MKYEEFVNALAQERATFLIDIKNKEKYPLLSLYLKHRNVDDTVAILHSIREMEKMNKIKNCNKCDQEPDCEDLYFWCPFQNFEGCIIAQTIKKKRAQQIRSE